MFRVRTRTFTRNVRLCDLFAKNFGPTGGLIAGERVNRFPITLAITFIMKIAKKKLKMYVPLNFSIFKISE